MALHLLSTGISFADFADSSATNASTTSELLDEYEEGTFVVTVDRGTVAPADVASWYSAIGRMVHIRWSTTNFSDKTTASSIIYAGFPFAAKYQNSAMGTGFTYNVSDMGSFCFMWATTSTVKCAREYGNTTLPDPMYYNQLGSNPNLYMDGTYQT